MRFWRYVIFFQEIYCCFSTKKVFFRFFWISYFLNIFTVVLLLIKNFLWKNKSFWGEKKNDNKKRKNSFFCGKKRVNPLNKNSVRSGCLFFFLPIKGGFSQRIYCSFWQKKLKKCFFRKKKNSEKMLFFEKNKIFDSMHWVQILSNFTLTNIKTSAIYFFLRFQKQNSKKIKNKIFKVKSLTSKSLKNTKMGLLKPRILTRFLPYC